MTNANLVQPANIQLSSHVSQVSNIFPGTEGYLWTSEPDDDMHQIAIYLPGSYDNFKIVGGRVLGTENVAYVTVSIRDHDGNTVVPVDDSGNPTTVC